MKINPIEFGKRLHDFRKKQNLTQTELADLLNTTQGNIGHIENGRRKPGADLLRNLYIQFPNDFEYLLLGRSLTASQSNESNQDAEEGESPLTPFEQFLLKYSESSNPVVEELKQSLVQTLAKLERITGNDSQREKKDSN